MSSSEFHVSTHISQEQLVNYSHQENCQLITLYFECFHTMYPACISYQRIELKYQTINNENSYLLAKMMTLLNVNISLATPDSSATNLLLKLNMHIPISSRQEPPKPCPEVAYHFTLPLKQNAMKPSCKVPRVKDDPQSILAANHIIPFFFWYLSYITTLQIISSLKKLT